MRLASFALSAILTLALASAAPAWPNRVVFWPGTSWGGGPTWNYGSQPYYNYMPSGYGYGSYPYGYGYPYGAGYGGYGYSTPYLILPFTSNYVAPVDYGPPARARNSLYPAVPYSEFAAQEQQQSSESRGFLTINLPTTDAKVWINDRLMTQTGRERSFQTPVLGSTSRSYTFDIKASWTDDLGPRTQQKEIQVRAGETRTLDFPLQSR